MRVLIVEDDVWVRRGLTTVLTGVEVTSHGTGRDALSDSAQFDVAIVDIGLPDISGIEVITALRKRGCVPVAFTVFDDPTTVLDALRAGARGYLLKSTPTEQILPKLREALAGGMPLSAPVAALVVERMLAGEEPNRDLTKRELDVLTLLARGATYAQVADALSIGVGTVQGYVKSIYGKLDVASKAEAAVAAVRLGLVR